MTDVATLTLAQFVAAALAEDEAVARAALGPDDDFGKRSYYSGHGPHRDDWGMWTFHVDPARVLADVEAKRRLVAMQLVTVNRILAVPYRDHPDYRLEWTP